MSYLHLKSPAQTLPPPPPPPWGRHVSCGQLFGPRYTPNRSYLTPLMYRNTPFHPSFTTHAFGVKVVGTCVAAFAAIAGPPRTARPSARAPSPAEIRCNRRTVIPHSRFGTDVTRFGTDVTVNESIAREASRECPKLRDDDVHHRVGRDPVCRSFDAMAQL